MTRLLFRKRKLSDIVLTPFDAVTATGYWVAFYRLEPKAIFWLSDARGGSQYRKVKNREARRDTCGSRYFFPLTQAVFVTTLDQVGPP